MLLFHGSKADFIEFDPKHYGSGERCGAFEGWYFVEYLKGAYNHVRSYLREIDGSGFVYVCSVPDECVVVDCEDGYTDSRYHGQAFGVRLADSHRIRIVDVLPMEALDEEVIGMPKKYLVADTQAPLKSGYMSYLKAVE